MESTQTFIYQTKQIRELEQLAEVSSETLMQRAAHAALNFLLHRWPKANKLAIVCGGGNNGGDGYVLARLAKERGLTVNVWQLTASENLKNQTLSAYQACLEAGVSIYSFEQHTNLKRPDLLIDAVCGIGLNGHLREETQLAIEAMQNLQVPILSLDVPTGIDADTGQVLGKAIRADATITFIGLKLGLLTGSGVSYAGEVCVDTLQLSPEVFAKVLPVAEKIQLENYTDYLKPRLRDWHKGLSGHVLIIGSYVGFSGAARLAGMGALRVGAGLVSIATHPEHAHVMNAECPELMCHGVDDVKSLQSLLDKAAVIVIGPGLAQTAWSKMLWEKVLQQAKPLVIDADGLNLLADTPQQAISDKAQWVLTPHPGEAARLLGCSVKAVQDNRLAAVKAIQKQYGGVCILKGAGTMIYAPDSLPALCDKGNPGMASAGMGDVLSGVIAGLIAQGIPLAAASKLGVYLHAASGDLAAQQGERGIVASDLLPYLHQLVNVHR